MDRRWTARFTAFSFIAAMSLSANAVPALAGKLEDDLAKAMLMHCVTSVVKNEDAAVLATQQKLVEFPADQAKTFAKDGGRVFVVPAAEGSAVLVARTQPNICSMPIRKADASEFWKAVEVFFGPREGLPFKLIETKTLPDGAKYVALGADFHGPVVLQLTMSPQPKERGMQGLMSFSRVQAFPPK